jgi:hypothetical protein
VRPEELERRLRQRLDALGLAPRAELLHVLMLPDFERADRIGEFWGYPESRAFAELLIDCEEDRILRAGGSVLPEGLSPFSDVPELPKPPDVQAECLRNDSDCDPGTEGLASPPGMARRCDSLSRSPARLG